MKRLLAGAIVLGLAACASTPKVEVTDLGDGRFLIGTWPSGELPDPDVLGTAMAKGEVQCQQDGKTAEIAFDTVEIDGKEMDQISYRCVAQ